jgi:hypothetical protein
MRVNKERLAKWKGIESKLKIADIILTTDKQSYLSAAIRKATKGHWSHAALVFFIPNKKLLFNNTLVIEALDNGIEIHRIQKYTRYLDQFDIGVKRVPGLTDELREKVLAFMLNNVDVPYDFTRLFAYLLKKILGNFVEKYKERLINKDDFVCSTFAQKAFWNAMPEDKKASVIFKKDFKSEFSLEEVTPADIARSKNCIWLYNPHR